MVAVLIRNGVVYDGTGNAPYRGDVAVDGQQIVRVGDCSGLSAQRVISAAGLAIAPGFVDMHTHSDLTLPGYPLGTNSIQQGVTTEVVGNCGFSPAPVSPAHEAELREYLVGWGPTLPWGWQSFGDYLEALEASQPAVNTVPLVGHGAIRIATMGFDDRAPSEGELGQMKVLLRQALDDGAWGMSSGLVYAPGVYCATDELIALGRELAVAGGLYASHVRGESDAVLDSVAEAIRIGETAGVPVEISHLKAIGRDNWGKVQQLLALIEAARQRGVAVQADCYPYLAGSTFLSNLLPPWAHAGGIPALVARLRSDEQRARMRYDLAHGLPGWSNQFAGAADGWNSIMVSQVRGQANQRWEGRTIAAAARETDKDPFDFYCDLLAEENASVAMIAFYMSEPDMERAVASPLTVIGSDSIGVVDAGARVHPRSYGTFVRVLGVHVRERGQLTLEQAIHKMSGKTAASLGLRDRGFVRPGQVADLAVFDPASVGDRATYEQPTQAPRGVEYVLVNGAVALEDGQQTEVQAGQVLRKRRG